jgi:hypothetical protein
MLLQRSIEQTKEILPKLLVNQGGRIHHDCESIHQLPAFFVRPRHIECEELVGGPETGGMFR